MGIASISSPPALPPLFRRQGLFASFIESYSLKVFATSTAFACTAFRDLVREPFRPYFYDLSDMQTETGQAFKLAKNTKRKGSVWSLSSFAWVLVPDLYDPTPSSADVFWPYDFAQSRLPRSRDGIMCVRRDARLSINCFACCAL